MFFLNVNHASPGKKLDFVSYFGQQWTSCENVSTIPYADHSCGNVNVEIYFHKSLIIFLAAASFTEALQMNIHYTIAYISQVHSEHLTPMCNNR